MIPALALACFAQQPERPACDARHRGEIWRPAHSDGACAGPEICTVKRYRYRWEPLTVHASQLSRDLRERGTACETAPSPAPPAQQR